MINRVRDRKPIAGARTIDRARIDELASKPWYEHFKIIATIFKASSAEEFDRLEPGFNRAYRELYKFVRRSKRNPRPEVAQGMPATGDPQSMLQDPDLGGALDHLVGLLVSSRIFNDPAITPRMIEVGSKIDGLARMTRVYIRRGTILPGI